MIPEIPETGGAELRIAEGVKKHVSVAVPVEASIVRDLDPSEDQSSPRNEAVHVVAEPHADLLQSRFAAHLELQLLAQTRPSTRGVMRDLQAAPSSGAGPPGR